MSHILERAPVPLLTTLSIDGLISVMTYLKRNNFREEKSILVHSFLGGGIYCRDKALITTTCPTMVCEVTGIPYLLTSC